VRTSLIFEKRVMLSLNARANQFHIFIFFFNFIFCAAPLQTQSLCFSVISFKFVLILISLQQHKTTHTQKSFIHSILICSSYNILSFSCVLLLVIFCYAWVVLCSFDDDEVWI